jgi:hypothetical protein
MIKTESMKYYSSLDLVMLLFPFYSSMRFPLDLLDIILLLLFAL